MAIDRIGSVGKSGEAPEPQRPAGTKKTTETTPAFGDVLAAALERDIHEAIKPERGAAELLGHMLGYNDAQLTLAMSIIASWEAGRREAVRAGIEARQHEAGMQRLLAEFARQVTTVSPAMGATQTTIDQRFGHDRMLLEIAMRLRQEGGKPDDAVPPTTNEEEKD